MLFAEALPKTALGMVQKDVLKARLAGARGVVVRFWTIAGRCSPCYCFIAAISANWCDEMFG